MAIVSGPLGTVLHTGDFRYNGAQMIKEINIPAFKLDILYMDNTFSTMAENFPTQEDAYNILKNKIITFWE